MASKGTPGKFYRMEAALNLLGTVRAGGISASIAVDDVASGEEQEHFDRFCNRLHGGDLVSTFLNMLAISKLDAVRCRGRHPNPCFLLFWQHTSISKTERPASSSQSTKYHPGVKSGRRELFWIC